MTMAAEDVSMELPFMVSYYPSPRPFEPGLIKHADSLHGYRGAGQKGRGCSKLPCKAHTANGCSGCRHAGVQLAQMRISSSSSLKCRGLLFLCVCWLFLEAHPAFGEGKGLC